MKKLSRFLPSRRRIIQLYAAVLYNAHLRGFAAGDIYTGVLKNACVPGLNCYSCPGAVGSCPLGSLQNALASTPHRFPFYAIGALMLFGLLLGRVVCGFLCPFGWLQELLHKIPTPKIKKGPVTRALSRLKYGILIGLVLLIPLLSAFGEYAVPAFCKYVCPAGTLEGAVGLLAHPDNAEHFGMLGWLFSWKFALLAVFLVMSVFLYRFFCRFFCPLGAIYGFFCRIAVLGVKLDDEKCVHCGKCVAVCPVDIRRVGDHECIQCGACVSACPVNAIRWKAAPKKHKQAARTVAWAAAILLLAAALIFVNLPAAEAPASPAAETGYLPGMAAPDFRVPLTEGGEIALSDLRGQVVVINFWATWCGPCVKEMPHFQRAAELPGVTVLAIHSSIVTDDIDAFLAEQGYTGIAFALDETGEVIRSFGGSTMLPMTVIVNRDGVVTYNAVGSVDYELLAEEIAQAE